MSAPLIFGVIMTRLEIATTMISARLTTQSIRNFITADFKYYLECAQTLIEQDKLIESKLNNET